MNRVFGFFGIAVLVCGKMSAEAADGAVGKAKELRSEFVTRASFLDVRALILEIRERRNPMLIPEKASALRCQVREQLVMEMKCAVVAARQELSDSLDEARAKSVEQARKLAAEVKEVARERGRKVEF